MEKKLEELVREFVLEHPEVFENPNSFDFTTPELCEQQIFFDILIHSSINTKLAELIINKIGDVKLLRMIVEKTESPIVVLLATQKHNDLILGLRR